MAAYDYLCRTCDSLVTIRASFQEKDAGLRPQCPSCKGEDLRRVFSAVGIASGTPTPAGAAGGGGGCCGGGCCG